MACVLLQLGRNCWCHPSRHDHEEAPQNHRARLRALQALTSTSAAQLLLLHASLGLLACGPHACRPRACRLVVSCDPPASSKAVAGRSRIAPSCCCCSKPTAVQDQRHQSRPRAAQLRRCLRSHGCAGRSAQLRLCGLGTCGLAGTSGASGCAVLAPGKLHCCRSTLPLHAYAQGPPCCAAM